MRTDGQTDMTKLKVAFHHFSKAPKTNQHLYINYQLDALIIIYS